MKLFLVLSASFVVSVLSHCEGDDCLYACRHCAEPDNEDPEGSNGTSPFRIGSKVQYDCKELICENENATLVVDGHSYKSLVCFQGKWHYGFPTFLEETDSAKCVVTPDLDCDVNAGIQFVDGDFKCVCKPDYEDVTEKFPEVTQNACSNCGNKNLTVVLLIDSSGSMEESLDAVKSIAKYLVTFLKLGSSGNRVAVVSSSDTYNVVSGWGVNSQNEGVIGDAIESITAGGLSNIGYGMEGVKAELIQPAHDGEDNDHILIVLTDGAVKHQIPCIKDIIVAANNLEALDVETYVVATSLTYDDKLSAIANGVHTNVYDMFNQTSFYLANKLQRDICV